MKSKISYGRPLFRNIFICFVVGGLLASCSSVQKVESLVAEAKKNNEILTVPNFNLNENQIKEAWQKIKAEATKELDKIGAQDPKKVTFNSTIKSLEDLNMRVGQVISPIYFMWNTSPDQKIREVAKLQVEDADKWDIEQTYREDIYKVVKALADKKPPLRPVDQRLLDEYMKDYRQIGMHLPKWKKNKVKKLKAKLAGVTTEFSNNINTAEQTVSFTKEQLDGVPQDYLERWRKPNGKYEFNAKIFADYAPVVRFAHKAATRKEVTIKRSQTAMDKNLDVLQKMTKLRSDIANLLGYKTWAHLKLENKMAKNPKTVLDFLKKLDKGIYPKLAGEMEEVRLKKAELTKNPKAKLEPWDVAYYFNIIKKEKYNVDSEEVKKYFALNDSLQGMFDIYQNIFSLEFQKVDPPYKWVDDIELYLVRDKKSQKALGLFYLDLYPRKGKFGHFANIGLIKGGKRLSGQYQRPTVALVCNFAKPTKDKPSLLSHSDLGTLFHEFGHAMHSIMSTAEHASFSGTSVPWDFVEAPSQMLENWTWDKKVLDQFASHYQDKSKKFPEDLLERMKTVKNATVGRNYMFQLAIGTIDMKVHSLRKGQSINILRESNKIFRRTSGLPVPKNTARVASIGHLKGYDAGYYGYLWAENISEDMAEEFRKSPKGFLDDSVGLRLRNEIYAPGNEREISESIDKFLGRKRSMKPFLKKLGLTQSMGDKALN